jgi:uncharacterized membrane protein
MKSWSGIVFIVLMAALAVTSGLIIYFAFLPGPADTFSEFYLLNENGQACFYPQKVTAGQPVNVIVGIVNHEGKPAEYTVRIMAQDAIIKEITTGVLNNDEKWEERVSFTPVGSGKSCEVDFYLYRGLEETPCIKQPLILRLDIE